MFGHATTPAARRAHTPIREIAAFRDIPDDEIRRLERLITPVRLDAGDVLMHEGSIGSEVHIVLDGDLIVERDGDTVAVLGPGQVVGEQAVLLNEPRNATVTAASECWVAVMNRREFASVLEACPRLGRNILFTAIERAAAA